MLTCRTWICVHKIPGQMVRSLWIKIGLFLTQIPSQRHSEINKETENTRWNLAGRSDTLPCGDTWDSDRQICFSLQLYLPRTLNNFYYRFLCHLASLAVLLESLSGDWMKAAFVCCDWISCDRISYSGSRAVRKGPKPTPPWVRGGASLETCSHDSPAAICKQPLGEMPSKCLLSTVTSPCHSCLVLVWTEETTTKVRTKCDQECVLSPDYEALWRVTCDFPGLVWGFAFRGNMTIQETKIEVINVREELVGTVCGVVYILVV